MTTSVPRASRPGRLLEVASNRHPRGMTIQSNDGQNPAYRPSDFFYFFAFQMTII